MSIRINGPSVLSTPPNTLLFNASQAAISCRIKVDPASGTLPNNAILFGRSSSQGFLIQATTASSLPAIKVTLIAQTGSTNFSYTFTYTPGRSYHLAAVWDSVNIQQTIYLNGTPIKTANIASLLQNGSPSSYFQIGSTSLAANSIVYVDDCYLWSGTALNDADVLALRDRTVDPMALYPANRVWGVTLNGTNGATVAAGDAGLVDSVAARNLTPSGTGTLTWSSDALGYVPAIATTPRVLASGKTIAFYFNDSITNAPVYSANIVSNPSVAVNGGPATPLTNPIASISGISVPYTLYALPTPVSASDVVTYSASDSWAQLLSVAGTSYPPVLSGAAAALTAVNGTGQDNVAIPAPTMQIGINVANETYYAKGHLSRNLARASWLWVPSPTFDSNGNLTSFYGQSASLTIPYGFAANGIDNLGHVAPAAIPWLPDNPNRYTVVWDEASPTNDSNFRLRTSSNNLSDSRAVITERTDLAVDPPDGIRRTRVYEVAYAANPSDYTLRLRLYCDRVDWSNLYVFGPGNTVDFVDVVDEAAKAYIAGASVVRYMGATYANNSPVATRAMLRPFSDTSNNFVVPLWATVTQAGPVNNLADYTWGTGWLAASFTTSAPHGFYTGQAISFQGFANTSVTPSTTLVGGISASASTITVVSSSSLRNYDYLAIDSEWCQITAISGTTLTVNRGVNGTTAATHLDGAAVTCYPQAVFAYDGVTRAGLFAVTGPMVVTSPTTFEVLLWHGNTTLGTDTVNALAGQTFALTSQAGFGNSRPGMSFEEVFRSASTLGVSPWINVPFAANDDCVQAIAEMARDHLTPGLKVWVEFSNEIWNTAPGFTGQAFGAAIMANKAGLGRYQGPRWGALRAAQVHTIFANVLGAAGRGGDLVRVIGWQWAGAYGTRSLLDFCVANGVQIDALAIAPYRDFPAGWGAAADGFDSEQLHDLLQLMLTHSSPLDTPRPGGLIPMHQTALAATYPTAKLVGYEGSVETVLSSNMTNYVARTHDVVYHPQMYNTYRAFLSAMQQGGMSLFCHFLLTDPNGWASSLGGWSMYYWHGQEWGRGDGSDGKADNRNCLATTKPATVQQDLQNVSVVGQAWKDWAAALPDQSLVGAPLGASGALGSSAIVVDASIFSPPFGSRAILPDIFHAVTATPTAAPLASAAALTGPTVSFPFVSTPSAFNAAGELQQTVVLGKLYANPNTLEYQTNSEPIRPIAGRSVTSSMNFFAGAEPFTTASQVVSVSLGTSPSPIEATAAAANPAVIGNVSLPVSASLSDIGSLGNATPTVGMSMTALPLSTTTTLGSPHLATAHAMNLNDLGYFKQGEPAIGLAGQFSTTGLDTFSQGEPFTTLSVVGSTPVASAAAALTALGTLSTASAATTSQVSATAAVLAAHATLNSCSVSGSVLISSATIVSLAVATSLMAVVTSSTFGASALGGSGDLSAIALYGGVLFSVSANSASAALAAATASGSAAKLGPPLFAAGVESAATVMTNAALGISPIASPAMLGVSYFAQSELPDVLALAGSGTLPLARHPSSQIAKRYIIPRRPRAR